MSKPQENQSTSPITAITEYLTSKKLIRSCSPELDSSNIRRLIIVANRLPITIKQNSSSNDWTFIPSSGGLVSALKGVSLNMVWVGWAGTDIPLEQQTYVKQELRKLNCVPVFLDENTIDLYYNGFSNSVLWPLFHYSALPIEDIVGTANEQWRAYQDANRLFCSATLTEYQEGDFVWVHDYHLMLLPAFLRSLKKNMTIGWFLHTPFPTSEIYRMLPFREEILRGVLSSNLVGFHIYDYARHFKSSCARILGMECTPDGIDDHGRFCGVGTFPIGIDAQLYANSLDLPEVKKLQAEYHQKFQGKQVLICVDRLDVIKGIPHKIYAYEKFLENNPEYIGKVVLVQIAVPSRLDVPEYQRLKSLVHTLVGRVNGRFSTFDSVPLIHLDRSVNFYELCALYSVSNACIISSLRDGMNLVSYEYVACQRENHGILLLSEFAGAAQSLGAGSIRFNPWDITELSGAIKYALSMGKNERKMFHKFCFQYICKHTAQHWANSFVRKLSDTIQYDVIIPVLPPRLNHDHIITSFQNAKNRVIIIGLIGALIKGPSTNKKKSDQKSFLQIRDSTRFNIHRLATDQNTTIIAVTSRGKGYIDSLLGDTNCWLAAENGYFGKQGSDDQWKNLAESVDLSWMDPVYTIFKYFVERTPRSFIQVADSHLSWLYRMSDPDFAKIQARDLLSHLMNGPLANTPTEVVNCHRIIQVRPINITKGLLAERFIKDIYLKKGPIDFVLCMGNFLTRDEDIFTLLEDVNTLNKQKSPESLRSPLSNNSFNENLPSPGKSTPSTHSDSHIEFSVRLSQYMDLNPIIVTATVGKKASHASFYLQNDESVDTLLFNLAKLCPIVENILPDNNIINLVPGDENTQIFSPNIIPIQNIPKEFFPNIEDPTIQSFSLDSDR